METSIFADTSSIVIPEARKRLITVFMSSPTSIISLDLLASINWDLKNNYIPTIFLTVFAVLIVNLLLIFALAVLDHQFAFW